MEKKMLTPDDIKGLADTYLKCRLCNDNLNTSVGLSRLLPCLHSFCVSCLEKNISDKEIICPVCYEKHFIPKRGLDELPSDPNLKDLKTYVDFQWSEEKQICGMCEKTTDLSHRCKQCEVVICDGCVLIHRKVRKLTHHELFPIRRNSANNLVNEPEEFSSDAFCTESDHTNELLRIYCSSPCRMPVCILCAFCNHFGHQQSLLRNVYCKERLKANNFYSEIESKVKTIENVIQNVQKEMQLIRENALQEKNSMEDTLGNAKEIMDSREKKLLEEVDVLSLQKDKILENQAESLQHYKDSRSEAIVFFQQSLGYNNKPAFLQISKSILRRLTELGERPYNVDPHTTATSFRCVKSATMFDFQDNVSVLAKVLASNANVFRCQNSAPTHCPVNEICPISAKLISSCGSVISDEDVTFIITEDGERKIEVNCTFSDINKAFEGKWCPIESGMFQWTLLSNGIALTANNLVCVEDKCKITEGKINNLWTLCIRLSTSNWEMVFSFHDWVAERLFESPHTEFVKKKFSVGEVSVLFDKNGKVIAIGEEAEYTYEDKEDVRLCRLSEDNLKVLTAANSPSDARTDMTVSGVIVSSIRYLQELCYKDLEKHRVGVTSADVFLVLILPAHFQNIAKDITPRTIGKEKTNFCFVSEIDAILSFYDNIKWGPLSLETKAWHHFSAGCRYMLLHCGGNTQATIVSFDRDGKQQRHTCEETVGGLYIRKRVLDVLGEIIGNDVLDDFKRECYHDYLFLLEEQDIVNRSVKTTADFKVRLTSSLLCYYEETKGKFLREEIEAKYNLVYDMKRSGGIFRINAGFVIEECFQNILEYTEKTLAKYQTNNILLYGGHANSECFVSLMLERFPDIRIVAPNSADLAVAEGGAIYGHLY